MTDRVHIPRHNAAAAPIAAGTWYVSLDGDLWHRCPKCNKASVMLNHSVTESGEVNASIACFAPCNYHVYGILDDWTYGIKAAGEKARIK